MATNYVQDGDVLTYTNSTGSPIAAGAVVPMSNRCGVALVDIAAGASGSVQMDGVFSVGKTTSQTWSVGQALYHVSGTGKLSTTSTGNVPAGFAAAAAGEAANTGLVLLGGQGAQAQAAVVAALAGTLTGTVDGTLADVSAIAISTSGGNTYADSAVNTAVNTAITSVNLQLKELQTTLNAVIAALKAAGLMASS